MSLHLFADLPVRRILALSLALSLIVLGLRGCFFLKSTPQEHAQPDPGQQIKVYRAKSKTTIDMDSETYLVGVVAAEMPASFELEALKAQAIAARTYTMRKLASPCGRGGAVICTDSTCCQAYRTDDELRENWGKSYAQNIAKIRNAVAATSHMVALYAGDPIEALYHSSSGGRTEDAQHVFAHAKPYLIGVDSPNEESSAKYEASVEVSAKEFARLVNKKRARRGSKPPSSRTRSKW